MTPVSGATVTATNRPVQCNGMPLADNVRVHFTTGSDEWYNLGSDGLDAMWSVGVGFQGQVYNFSSNMHIIAATCATLLVPSGNTSVTARGYQSTGV